MIGAIAAPSAQVNEAVNSATLMRDQDVALDRLAQAACNGDSLADLRIGEMLFFGQGLKRDVPLAYVHARRAKERLDGENANLASALASMIAGNMTPGQRAGAEHQLQGPTQSGLLECLTTSTVATSLNAAN